MRNIEKQETKIGEKMNIKLGQIIASKLAKEMTSRIPQQSKKKFFLSKRKQEIDNLCISYTNQTVETIRSANFFNCEKSSHISVSENKIPHAPDFRQRLKIIRRKKKSDIESQVSEKKSQQMNHQKALIKKNGVIPLKDEQIQDEEYEAYIENLRKKKEKLNEAMQQFEKRQSELKLMKKSTDLFITNFQGKLIKLEKREPVNIEKSKVKPIINVKSAFSSVEERESSQKNETDDDLFLNLKKTKKERFSKNSFKSEKSKFRSIKNILESKKYLEQSIWNKMGKAGR